MLEVLGRIWTRIVAHKSIRLDELRYLQAQHQIDLIFHQINPLYTSSFMYEGATTLGLSESESVDSN